MVSCVHFRPHVLFQKIVCVWCLTYISLFCTYVNISYRNHAYNTSKNVHLSTRVSLFVKQTKHFAHMCFDKVTHVCILTQICFCFVHMFLIRRVCVIWKPRLRLMFDIHDYFVYKFVHLQLHLSNYNQHVCVFVDVSVIYVLNNVDVLTQVLLWWHAYVWLSAHMCDIGTNLSIRLRMQDCHTSVNVCLSMRL